MRKNIYTLFAAFSMLLGISAANAQAPVIVYYTVDMSAANLGECAAQVTNECTNSVACAIIPFDKDLDGVQPMGGEYNNWGNAPWVWETVGCGMPWTPSDTADMVPVSPGSLIYTTTATIIPDANGYTSFKFRIDHAWDNDEIRHEGSGGNRSVKLPASATSVLIACVFDDTTMVISDVSGISNPTSATIQKVYPNPSSESSRIAYNVLQAGNVQVYVCDAIGRKVAVLVNKNLSVGPHETEVNTSNLDTGMYFVTVQIGSSRVTQKLTVAH
jgi:hypothetical protein